MENERLCVHSLFLCLSEERREGRKKHTRIIIQIFKNKEKISQIKELVSELNEHRHAYYNLNAPSITDKEYDQMFDTLKKLEMETGVVLSNSPTQNVGYYPVSSLKKVKHPTPLLSLDKTKQVAELCSLYKRNFVLLMLKLDGLTTKLVYEDGKLLQASTRGDGETGEDITVSIAFIGRNL